MAYASQPHFAEMAKPTQEAPSAITARQPFRLVARESLSKLQDQMQRSRGHLRRLAAVFGGTARAECEIKIGPQNRLLLPLRMASCTLDFQRGGLACLLERLLTTLMRKHLSARVLSVQGCTFPTCSELHRSTSHSPQHIHRLLSISRSLSAVK